MRADTQSAHQLPVVSLLATVWNAREETRFWLASLDNTLDYPRHLIEIVIHDNASTDGTADAIESVFETIRPHGWRALKLIRGRDLCITHGINTAYAAADQESEFFFRVDNDTFPAADSLLELIQAMRRHQDAAAIGCKICFLDRPEILQSGALNIDWYGRPYGNVDAPRDSDCDYVTGACVLMRRAAIEQVGRLYDTSFYMWAEEPEFCLQARRLGWRTVYSPSTRAYHNPGIGTGQRPNALLFLMHRNMVRLHRRFGQSSATLAWYLLRSGLHAAKRGVLKGEWQRLRGFVSGSLDRRFDDRDWQELRAGDDRLAGPRAGAPRVTSSQVRSVIPSR